MSARRRQRGGGFTLLEVMVAIAILAMSLTAIFASEAGAIKMAHRARKMGIAALLVRCKMGEIEEQVAAEGLPALDDSDSDACCEGAEVDGFSCDWEIAPIVLPDGMFGSEDGELAEDSEGGGEDKKALSPAERMKEEASGLDATSVLSGSGTGGLASAALGLVFPVLKPSFEQQIRRATVTVHWKEGDVEHSFDVTQYMVSDQPIVDPNLLQQQLQGAAPGGSATGSGTAPSTGSTGKQVGQ